MKHTHKLQFLIKTKDSIFNRKVYTTDEDKCQAQLGLGFETDYILIKDKRKHLSKTSDRVPKKVLECKHSRFD